MRRGGQPGISASFVCVLLALEILFFYIVLHVAVLFVCCLLSASLLLLLYK